MIHFDQVTKKFGAHTVLKEVDFTIQPNELIVLKGSSGAGKSTIVSLLIGATKPTEGNINIDGVLVNKMSPKTLQLYRRKLGVVHQDYKLLSRKTVFENVAFAMEACEEPHEKIQKKVPEILEKVGILHLQDKFPGEISGGEKQRTAIARSLIHDPSLLIADEPTGNLDEENIRLILELFKKLHQEGTTLLITTHNALVQNLLDGKSLTLQGGRIIENQPTIHLR